MINNPKERLVYLCATIPDLLKNIPESEFCLKPSPEKWSKKEVLGHIIDSAANNHQRFVRAQFEFTPTIVYDQNKWVECNYYNSVNTFHLIEFWRTYNMHLFTLIHHIPEFVLKNKFCNIGEVDKISLEDLITEYVDHLEHHLKQIVEYK